MPGRDVLATFTNAASERMAAPVNAYYDAVDQFGADSLEARLALYNARQQLAYAVRANHIDAALIAGAGNLSPEQRYELQQIIAEDVAYVEGFADAMPELSRGQALVRANLYVSTQRNTINEITLMELPPLPIQPKSADLICTWHCKCDLDIRFLYGDGNFDVYWRLDPLGREHCDDCLRLAAIWSPLQIRNGQILGAKMLKPQDFERLKAAFERLVA